MLFPEKMSGAGKGPGIGWSRAQLNIPEKLIYMQPASFDRSRSRSLALEVRPHLQSQGKAPWGRV